VAAFFVQIVQFHPENDYMVVVEVEVVDLVIATMKAQARTQDPVAPERPSSWTYSIFKKFKRRIVSRKTTRKYS
jgi:hypothetical protein